MLIEDKINMEANNMLNAYYPYYFKKYPRNRKQLATKYFKYFEKASRMFCCRDDFDAEKLIESFMLDGFKYPQQLAQEHVWEVYKNYLPALHNKKSPEVEIVENIVAGAIVLKKEGNSVKQWLSKKTNQMQVDSFQMRFSPMIFSFSKEFNNYCNAKGLENKYKNDSVREKVYSIDNPKVIEKIKSILGEDFL